MNLPNKLTIFRMIIIPIMVIIYIIDFNKKIFGISISYWILNFLFIIASFTDYLDGKIARKNNQITTFGKFADPLADKILVITAMIILVSDGNLPAWIPIIVIYREFIVSGYRLVSVEKEGKVISANIWGKIKTVTQMIAIILMFININGTNVFGLFFREKLSGVSLIINIFTTVIMIISVIATILSGWIYIKNGKEVFND